MRDETYDRYKNEPPLDAYLTPFAFRITPPRFLDIAKRRLELIIEDMTREVPKSLEYELPSGTRIKYPATELGAFLMGVYRALFHPARNLRVLLEALAGRDVRQALQMFSDILMSGHLGDDQVLVAKFSQGKATLPESVVIRVLMRTKFKYFADGHGYIYNLFACDEASASTFNFLLVEILDLLARQRKRQGELGIEGYRSVVAVAKEMASLGYSNEDCLWGLNRLLTNRLIVAEHQRTDSVDRDDYVKISASGYYHLRFLVSRFEYAAGVAMDTWLRQYGDAQKIAGLSELRDGEWERPRAHRLRRVKIFLEALECELLAHR